MTVACQECGAFQTISPLPRRSTAECYRCDTALERTAGRSATATLALSLAAFVLFFPGHILPAMRSRLMGAAIEARAVDGVTAFFADGWPIMASFVAMFVIVAPMLRAAFLVLVLAALKLGYRTVWQGRLFRLAQAMRGWAMAEVYLAAGAVTYSRVAAQLHIEVLPGGWCFIAAVLLLLAAEASLDRRRVWSALRPESPPPRRGQAALSCIGCQLVVPNAIEGQPCPRCARRLRHRRNRSVQRTAALALAALILLYPAFFLPMTVTVQPNGVFQHTVMGGVGELFHHGYWYLGLILFFFSVMVPGLKLLALLWMTLSVRWPHRRFMLLRVRLHRLVDAINHWSFIDPFIVALNAAMLSYPGVVAVAPAAGALAFSLVIVLTMIASRMFDARLMWDALERQPVTEPR